jgi:hypothetical protein
LTSVLAIAVRNDDFLGEEAGLYGVKSRVGLAPLGTRAGGLPAVALIRLAFLLCDSLLHHVSPPAAMPQGASPETDDDSLKNTEPSAVEFFLSFVPESVLLGST